MLTEVLVETNKDLRMIATYYRVKLLGDLFEDLDGKEFIYKRGPRENLMTVQGILKQTMSKKLLDENADKVVILSNKDVKRSELDKDKLYIQLASVMPYFGASEPHRANVFEQNFNIRRFIFEAAFSKNKEDATGTTKMKVIFEVGKSFPYCKNRIEVVKREEIILTPIENAVELIKDRITRIQDQLDTKNPSINQLQQLLQGSVVPMVNEGPLKICQTFLSAEEAPKYPKAQVEDLRSAMGRFIHLCGFAVKLNKSLITQEHVAFQNMVEQHYGNLKLKVKEYTDVE